MLHQKRKLLHKLPCVGIDILGSDRSPQELLDALLPELHRLQNIAEFMLFCEPVHAAILPSFLSYMPATTLAMQESPMKGLRKPDTSVTLGIKALKQGTIDALLSMGNTGALTLQAHRLLPPISSSWKRPALLAIVPSKQSTFAMLDIGANLEGNAHDLVGFAAMGVAYQQACGIAHPKLHLLNLGSEPYKGPKVLVDTYQQLHNHPTLHAFFCGNIEGHTLFTTPTDVVVTLGFSGNICLKTAEGMAELFCHDTSSSLTQHLLKHSVKGALFVGLQGLLFKCHGRLKPHLFAQNIEPIIHLIEHRFLANFQQNLLYFEKNAQPPRLIP